ncbi:MAG: Hsp20/alpha crystallin family protein [Prolixibacteraceae bacterium]|jgi:HSP20 family protein|nr:Hsp20/alpha crystallin family protein [Prolixibacteraceae bacterium]MBT6004337.1 Hsp20/alpha crystallin family protein [Prolixibacteraceae bacterium]MBT6764444.1 Hsp20/alpha crystallin family protein [Prolixibacteraceae bacterium]MBT7000384.1 Hsp20/alpha crystallin family protein [Prolixibacteraceae bacterium]MBT7395711.1 Hsp20/alpha crystallin family protein [Prolixibacteraceae bacterium]
MNLVRFNNPRYQTNRVLVDELFNNFFRNDYHESYVNKSRSKPATNVFETEDDFKIEILLPGFKKEDVALNYQKNLLTIKVENKVKEENSEEFKYVHREFGAFNFEKQYRIPKSVNDEKISAQFENGVLNIVLPKKEEALEKAPVDIKIS